MCNICKYYISGLLIADVVCVTYYISGIPLHSVFDPSIDEDSTWGHFCEFYIMCVRDTTVINKPVVQCMYLRTFCRLNGGCVLCMKCDCCQHSRHRLGSMTDLIDYMRRSGLRGFSMRSIVSWIVDSMLEAIVCDIYWQLEALARDLLTTFRFVIKDRYIWSGNPWQCLVSSLLVIAIYSALMWSLRSITLLNTA